MGVLGRPVTFLQVVTQGHGSFICGLIIPQGLETSPYVQRMSKGGERISNPLAGK